MHCIVVLTILGFSCLSLAAKIGRNKQVVHPEEESGKFEGDIDLDGDFRNIINSQSKRWTNGKVPYILQGYTPSEEKLIEDSLRKFQERINKPGHCMEFFRRTNEHNYILYLKGGGCYSAVGMVGGVQKLSLDPGCLIKNTVIHETIHALGVWHEQSRPDRDAYIDIIWDNIKPKFKGNFAKQAGSVTLDVPYNYASVMHYSKGGFSIDGGATMLPKDRSISIGVGVLHDLDVLRIRKMYNCKPYALPQADCRLHKFENTRQVGPDYKAVYVKDEETCTKLCTMEDKCVALSFNKLYNGCYLHNELRNPEKITDTTYFKKECQKCTMEKFLETQQVGPDFAMGDANTADHCADSCLQDEECVAVTYDPGSELCYGHNELRPTKRNPVNTHYRKKC